MDIHTTPAQLLQLRQHDASRIEIRQSLTATAPTVGPRQPTEFSSNWPQFSMIQRRASAASAREDFPLHAAAGSGRAQSARRSGSQTPAPRRAGRRAARAASFVTPPQPPLGLASASSAACVACGSGPGRRPACAISSPSARRPHAAPTAPTPARRSPGSLPDLRRGRLLLVKRNQHARPASQISLRMERATNNARGRGSI